jgi:hypothetical protein
MIGWLKWWWEMLWVWWNTDPETLAMLTSKKPHDPDDFVEAPRPE